MVGIDARLPRRRVQGRRQASTCRRTGRAHPQVHRRRVADAQSKMGGADWEKTRARVRKRGADIAGELVVLYRRRLATPGHAFAARYAVAARGGGGVPVRGDARPAPAIDEVKADMERADPDGPPRLRRRRVRQDRGRGARRVQGGAGRQAGRDPGARPRCSRASTLTAPSQNRSARMAGIKAKAATSTFASALREVRQRARRADARIGR